MHTARYFLVFAALFLGFFFAAPSAHAGTSAEKLFVIERSQNANYVQYDMQTQAGGADPNEPVVAYWILGAEKGQREALSWMEKKAYGFSVKPLDSNKGFELALKAYKGRSIGLYQSAGRWRAVMFIDNKSAFLTKLFVQVKSGGLIPSVEYIDVFGEDVKSGAPLRERLTPS